ncbi:MFS transporter [Pelomyxa schiedti]|nr:MFS transporter [Pelomyxa schiedti]
MATGPGLSANEEYLFPHGANGAIIVGSTPSSPPSDAEICINDTARKSGDGSVGVVPSTLNSNPTDAQHVPVNMVLILVFLFFVASGSCILTTAIYFIASEFYGFNAMQLYILGIGLGLTSMAAPLASNLILKKFAAYGMTARKMFAATQILCGMIVCVPLVCDKAFGQEAARRYGLPIYFTAIPYSFVCCMLWPSCESYTTSRNKPLEWTVGIYNMTWSSAVVVAVFAITPMISRYALETLCGVAGIHAVTLCLLFWFTSNPAPHNIKEDHKKVHIPLVSLRCNTIVKFQLPMMTLVMCSLTPYLPVILGDIGIPFKFQALMGATWMFTRVVGFTTLFFTRIWYRTLVTPIVTSISLPVSFAVAVISIVVFSGDIVPGSILVEAGLIAFGLTYSTIYSSGLCYSFEVGSVDVSSGALFEFALGLGNVGGPCMGFIIYLLAEYKVIPERISPILVICVTCCIAVVTITIGFIKGFRKTEATHTRMIELEDTSVN